MTIVGIMAVSFGVHSREWRQLRHFGWITLFLTFSARYFTEPLYSGIAMPLILSACQGIACFLFARRLWNPVEQMKNVETTAKRLETIGTSD